MGIFGRKPNPATTSPAGGHRLRGGCSDCDMRGPKRDTFRQANVDAIGHGRRMHGDQGHKGLYVEGTD